MPTVLVTSASRGIGREFVRQFAADGWRVIAACRHPEEVDAELRAFGDGVRPIALDVTDLASVEAVAREEDEPLDLLLNTAGVIGQGPTPRARSTTPNGRASSTSTPWVRSGCSTPSQTASPPPAAPRRSR